MHGTVSGDDLARAYVLGTLSPAERREVARSRQFDSALDAAIDRIEAQLAPLTATAGETTPPHGVFDRILAAVETEEERLAVTHRLPFAAGNWERYADGIEMKYLWDGETFLLRCEPGAIIPPHGHDLNEHLIVISGDLLVNGIRFGVGDYHTMPTGTWHEDARTEEGCILFVQSRP